MRSKVVLLPGQSFTVAAGATVSLEECSRFSPGDAAPTNAATLQVDGVGAEVVLSQPALAGGHAVEVLQAD